MKIIDGIYLIFNREHFPDVLFLLAANAIETELGKIIP